MTEIEIKEIVGKIYADRKARRTHPAGRTDSAGRWYPTDLEDCGGSGTCVRAPSRAWPWSYMLRCRTRKHIADLVAAVLAGNDAPADVRKAVESARMQIAA